MTTVADILKAIERIAPTYMKEEWDNVGLNCGHMDKEVRTVLVALDPFDAVCREAKEIGADLLVTHHALLWDPGFITDETQQGKNALYLIENGVAHINAHTNLDCAPGGVNDLLASKLGLDNIRVICPKGTDDNGAEYGLLRQGEVPQQPLEQFLATVKQQLGCQRLKYVSGGRPVCRVAVGGGSCASVLMDAYRAGCDTFVTADVKYNQFWDAQALGVNLIDAGHFHTECPATGYLAQQIQSAFPEIRVHISQTHTDCATFF
ncbi:MAG: Nif3-like dinuclear metal center hexameric protein [Oscillospiraceae bacterium]|nr:Nif3-like dinuclear metal center hexameric protein [Oscillospiraceae bacterium]